ncbi:thiolase-like protein [Lactarius sanguifluus]|nr:thiolase-like protein [Lactarius sanguifluus]
MVTARRTTMVAERDVLIIGVGCTAFTKTGLEAATKALLDAWITYGSVETAFVDYVYGASTTGQAVLYQLGLIGIPIVNVNSNVRQGAPRRRRLRLRRRPWSPSRPTRSVGFLCFAFSEERRWSKYGGGVEYLAKMAKNHKHSVEILYSQFWVGHSKAAVLASPQTSNELTKYMCSPTSTAYNIPPHSVMLTIRFSPLLDRTCCILANEVFGHTNRLENQAIELVATGLATDYLDAFAGRSAMDTVGSGITRRLADEIFAQAGASWDDIGVIELHDCFAVNELVTYRALGLCAADNVHRFVERGDNTYGGKYVVNPSGGLEVKGHPLGATGLAMHFSITWAGPMQAPGLFDLPDSRGKYGLVHNIGLGGAVVVQNFTMPTGGD